MTALHELMEAHVASGQMPGLVTLVARGDDVEVDVIGSPRFADREPLRPRRHLPHRVADQADHRGDHDVAGRGGHPAPRRADRRPRARARRPPGAARASTPSSTTRFRPQRSITVEDLLSFADGLRVGDGTPRHPSDPAGRGRARAAEHRRPAVAARLRSIPTSGSRRSARCRCCTSPASGGSTTRARRCSASCSRERPARTSGGHARADLRAARHGRHRVHRAGRSARTGSPPSTRPIATPASCSVVDAPPDSWWSTPPSLPDASGWLVSTIDDYWTFVSMLLRGGSARGRRDPVGAIGGAHDHRPPHARAACRQRALPRRSRKLGLRHGGSRAAAPPGPLPSGVGWDGGSGTTWRSNAERGVTGILLTQRQLNSPQPPAVFDDFWAGSTPALEPSPPQRFVHSSRGRDTVAGRRRRRRLPDVRRRWRSRLAPGRRRVRAPAQHAQRRALRHRPRASAHPLAARRARRPVDVLHSRRHRGQARASAPGDPQPRATRSAITGIGISSATSSTPRPSARRSSTDSPR